MKTNITMKQITKNYNKRISICYCQAQYLLKGQEPSYYTKGIYGWNNDIYQIDYDTVIVTGYRNLQGNIDYKYETLEKYEKEAKHIYYNNGIHYDDKISKINDLLNQFIKEVIKA
nr:hypothetical protein [Catenibacterium mitsuokai]